MNRIVPPVAAIIVVLAGLSPAPALATINSVVVSGTTVTINGASFGVAKVPVVTLGGAKVSVAAGAYTATKITGTVPSALAGGSYRLTVQTWTSATKSTTEPTYEVAVGAVGPVGPQGPVGPAPDVQIFTGVEGPCTNGGVKVYSDFLVGYAYACNGVDGANGQQGPQGLKGDTGAAGATGPQGPTGPAGIPATMPTCPIGDSLLSTGTGWICCSDLKASCADILAASPGSASGIYQVKLVGLGGAVPINVYCDMTTNGGGWTLVLAYHHAANSMTPVSPGIAPLDPTASYSHLSTLQLASLPFSAMRFYCQTSAHSRVIDVIFATPGAISFVKGGGATALSYWTTFTALPSHTALLPAATSYVDSSGPDRHLTWQPFFVAWERHWNIGTGASRFECDDYANGPQNETLHQVWVR